ncbi:MAG: hypothetical protein WBZ36_10515 [Candidatus Nitrosopolaris sp.]
MRMRDFLEIIDAIIPSLNGQDPSKLVPVEYAGIDKPAKSKHFGPKVMIQYRYLIVLYVAGRVKSFINKFGVPLADNNIYFSARVVWKRSQIVSRNRLNSKGRVHLGIIIRITYRM